MSKYLICGDVLMALNPKVATSSFARAIIKRHHPEIDETILTAKYPEGQNADNMQWQNIVPYRTNPDRPVICLVREPVARFRSAMAQLGIDDVDAAINELNTEAGAYGVPPGTRVKLVDNVHFRPQSQFVGNPITYFKFPEQVEAAALALGLPLPLPVINENTGTKPTLTPEQETAVREFYSADVTLWDSLQ
jgi:hypothetical protein